MWLYGLDIIRSIYNVEVHFKLVRIKNLSCLKVYSMFLFFVPGEGDGAGARQEARAGVHAGQGVQEDGQLSSTEQEQQD